MPSRTKAADKPRRTAGRPKREDVAAIDGKLLAVALREFCTHGYGGSSLNRIVSAAEVSKTTLYARFSSKEELFRAIMHQQIERIDAGAALSYGRSGPDLEKGLKAFANRMLSLSLHGDLLEVNRLVSSESQRFPELGAAAAERMALGIKRIASFIRECADFDGVPCKDPDAVAEVFILMLRGWYVNVMLTNVPVSAARRERWVQRAVHTLLSARADW